MDAPRVAMSLHAAAVVRPSLPPPLPVPGPAPGLAGGTRPRHVTFPPQGARLPQALHAAAARRPPPLPEGRPPPLERPRKAHAKLPGGRADPPPRVEACRHERGGAGPLPAAARVAAVRFPVGAEAMTISWHRGHRVIGTQRPCTLGGSGGRCRVRCVSRRRRSGCVCEALADLMFGASSSQQTAAREIRRPGKATWQRERAKPKARLRAGQRGERPLALRAQSRALAGARCRCAVGVAVGARAGGQRERSEPWSAA